MMEKPEFMIYFNSVFDTSNYYPPNLCLCTCGLCQLLCHGRTGGCGEEYNQWLASTLAVQSGNCTASGSSGAKILWIWKYYAPINSHLGEAFILSCVFVNMWIFLYLKII